MKSLLSMVFLLFPATHVFAQKPDSLLKAANSTSRPDSQKVNLLNEAGIAFWKSGSDSMAVLCHEQSIDLAGRIPFPKGEIEARLQLVLMEMEYLSDLESAYGHLDAALALAKSIGNRFYEGQTYFRRAQLYSVGSVEHYGEVRPLYEKALSIFKELEDHNHEGKVYAQLASLEADEGHFAQAIDFLLRARKLQEMSGDAGNLRATLPNLGVMYMSIGMFEQALKCFDEAAKNARSQGDERILAFLSGQRGDIFLKQGKAEYALEELEEAEKRYRKQGSVQFLTGTYARMGDAWLKLGDENKAMTYALRADSLFKAITDGEDLLSHSAQILLGDVCLSKGDPRRVVHLAERGLEWAEDGASVLLKEASEYHRQLSAAYESLGDPGRALLHQKRFKILSDSLLNGEMIQRGVASSLGFDFEKSQQADQIRIQSLENKNLAQTRNISMILLAIGLGALLVAVWINRRLRRKNEELVRKNEEIEMALHKGQRIERKRVASELHDSLTTKIAGIRWQLESMDPAGLDPYNQKIVGQLLDIAGDAYHDIRLISHNMLPAILEKEGLVAAIQRLISQRESENGLKFSFAANIEQRLPMATEHQLYQITMELVNNIVKHSAASEAKISLLKSSREVGLVVTDNGKGFDLNGDEPAAGMGLANIKSRAESIGGRYYVSKPVLGGAQISVVVPHTEEAEARP